MGREEPTERMGELVIGSQVPERASGREAGRGGARDAKGRVTCHLLLFSLLDQLWGMNLRKPLNN